ncbi:MAG: hypothetical protein PHD81_00760 [Candidatus Nanoarchaeia archaeon]|nr:hypothetical protein [Candidatus Nanoarchaeia archaeon]MDD5587621.1 hypothetical protein [Candidatus Nanoarchaeia archaeon]
MFNIPKEGKPLYQDEEIKVDYLLNSFEDHRVYLKEGRGEELNYIIQRGILKDIARTPRGGLVSILSRCNPQILYALKEMDIEVDGLHVALCQAYAEQEERIRAVDLKEVDKKLKLAENEE